MLLEELKKIGFDIDNVGAYTEASFRVDAETVVNVEKRSDTFLVSHAFLDQESVGGAWEIAPVVFRRESDALAEVKRRLRTLGNKEKPMYDLTPAAIEARAAQGLCGMCGNNVFVFERGFRRCALCGTENLVGYKCPGCRSTSGVGDRLAGCAFCGQQLMPDEPEILCPVCGENLAYHVYNPECPLCGTR
jgi:ribosomal protein L37E